jgi:protein-S-isoprenylcysteine O-methyltransferase Ste14
MSFISAFEIGLWNAWLFILGLILINYNLASLIAKETTLFIWPQYNKKEKKILSIMMVVHFSSWIYSIFLPLKIDTAWFYTGLVIYLVGMAFLTMAVINFATTPVDKPVTKGVFYISRHPMYFGWFLIYISIGVACGSWIFLVIAMTFLILQMLILGIPEELMCLEKFGDAYREYMNKTPRWIGIPKSGKSD